MSTHIRRNSFIKHGFTSAVHELPAAMRQEKRTFLRLQELFPLYQIHSLHVDHILDDEHRVGQVQPRGFLDLKPLYHFLQGVQQGLMHTSVIADSSNLGKKEPWNRRQIKRELIRHRKLYAKLTLKNNTSPKTESAIHKPKLLCFTRALTKHFPERIDFFKVH